MGRDWTFTDTEYLQLESCRRTIDEKGKARRAALGGGPDVMLLELAEGVLGRLIDLAKMDTEAGGGH